MSCLEIKNYLEFCKYVYWLGKYLPMHMQEEAMDALYHCDDKYIGYIIDINNAATWDNGLKVICRIGYPRNKVAIKSLLYLFQDINWSTTELAVAVVKEIYDNEPDVVENAINAIVDIAKNDEDWLFGIEWLKKRLGIYVR